MKHLRKFVAAAIGVAAVAVPLSLASPASATVGDCPSNAMCLWNANAAAGTPFWFHSSPASVGWYNVPDNTATSGYNGSWTGCYWYGMNLLGGGVYDQVATFPYHTVVNLQGLWADNKIDDLRVGNGYSGC